MERKIGERFDFEDELLEVVEYGECEECYFSHQNCIRSSNIRGNCSSYNRTDEKSVIFEKADKSVVLLTKAHEELVRCGIESEIVDEIEEYLKTKL